MKILFLFVASILVGACALDSIENAVSDASSLKCVDFNPYADTLWANGFAVGLELQLVTRDGKIVTDHTEYEDVYTLVVGDKRTEDLSLFYWTAASDAVSSPTSLSDTTMVVLRRIQ